MFEINQHKSGVVRGRIRFPDGSWRQQTSGCENPAEAADTLVTMQYFMNQSNKLDLHGGPVDHGAMSRRATLVPVPPAAPLDPGSPAKLAE